MRIKGELCKCNVCGWVWYSREKALPIRCASCKSPYWNKKEKKNA